MKKFNLKLDNYFQITERGSNIKTELIAGLTTFFAMCYILAVNPGAMVGDNAILGDAVFIATAIGGMIGCLLMAFWAKMPFAQAPGMGLNAFFFSSFIIGAGSAIAGYQSGLAVIFLSGIVFLILSLTGARKKITEALPDCLKKSIPAGIGLFIAFIGFKNAGLVQANQFTFVQLGNIAVGDPKQTLTWFNIAPILVAFAGFMLIAILNKKNVKGSIFIGIIVTTFLYYLCTWTLPTWEMGDIGKSFVNFGNYGIGGCFKGFSTLFSGADFGGVVNIIMLVVTFCLVDMFDTMGTLQGTAAQAGMLDENGLPKNLNKCLMCDSVATVVGGICGTSTVTTFVESASGVAEGGRTGLTALVVSFFFFISMFLRPLFAIIPGVATAPALIFVGVLMLKNIKEVDMADLTSAVPAFLTLIMMPLTYSISNGIALGMISYTIMRLATLKFTKKDIMVAVLAVLFIIRFFLVKY